MAWINWDELGKQLTDWGGDYDVLGSISANGGVRDATPTITKVAGVPTGFSSQGQAKSGYDSTGRRITTTQDKPVVKNPTVNQQDKVAGVGGGGGGGGGGAPAKKLDTAQIASLDELLRSYDVIRDKAKKQAKLRQDEQRKTKDQERETEETKYQGKKVSALQDFAGAKTDTDLNTRETLENLMSSLSTLNLGGSRALTRQILNAANKSNRKANATQAQNQQGLDSAWNEYDAGYKDDITKIDDQYKYDTGEAERVWGQNRQNTLNKKADVYNAADYTGEREATMAEARGLTDHIVNSPFMNPQYTGKSRAMATPELADYQQDIATYDTSAIGADAAGLTPVAAGAMPGNLAVKAVAVNDKDLGVKKKLEGVDPILGV